MADTELEKDLEADDPYELVGMRFPLPPGVDGDEIQARCYIEEYALMGMPSYRVMHMFQSPVFAGTHAILQARGQQFIERLVRDVYGAEAALEVL